MTLLAIAGVMGLGALGGMFGALLGLGGGVFLVPALTLVYGLPFRQAAGIGLMTVIATSSVVSAQRAGVVWSAASLFQCATRIGAPARVVAYPSCVGFATGLLAQRHTV